MKKLYLDSGYLNMSYIIEEICSRYPYTFIIGGRGTGKTYGALKYVDDNSLPFMYMRRLASQADLINKQDFSPFRAVDPDIIAQPVNKFSSAFYHGEVIDDKLTPQGAPMGYTCALSTVKNMRGFYAEHIKLLIFDEFVPEIHERPLKEEAAALWNAYETINRNRELKGQPPLMLLGLANANEIANPIFLDLGITMKIFRMYETGQEIYKDDNRGLCVILLRESGISKAKAETSLYKLTKGSTFAEMAIENQFKTDVDSEIRSINLRELIPVCRVSEIQIYRHKSGEYYYVSEHFSGTPAAYGGSETELKRFKSAYFHIWVAYLNRKIVFENYLSNVYFEKCFK